MTQTGNNGVGAASNGTNSTIAPAPMSADTAEQARGRERALWALTAVNIIWGFNYAFAKLAVSEVAPFTFSLLRLCVAMVILLPLGIRFGFLGAIRTNWRQFALTGVFGITVTQAAFGMSLKLAPSSIIAVLSSIIPILIALMSVLFLGERIVRWGWLGMAIALGGVLLILGVSPTELDANGLRAALGGLIFLAGNTSWAAFNVFSKHLMATQDPIITATGTAVFGSAGLLVLSLFEVVTGAPIHIGFWSIFGALYAGILGTAFAFLVLNWALQRAEGIRVGAIYYFQPIFGVIGSTIFLSERPGLSFVAGALLVLSGVFLVTISRVRTVKPQPIMTDPVPSAASGR